MSISRAALRRLRLPLPPSSCGRILARQLHATTRKHSATEPTQYATNLPAQNVYHEFFPCTLHYYSWRGPTMALHGSPVNGFLDDLTSHLGAVEQYNLLGRDVVRVQEDGLVYPGPMSNDTVWNGAMLMPHTPFLLESTDNDIDRYEERKSAGRDVPEPYFITVPKGLRMPSTLFLAREDWEMFYLMPRAAMPLSALNRELNHLFSSGACSRLPYREWFRRYKVSDAYKQDGDLMSE